MQVADRRKKQRRSQNGGKCRGDRRILLLRTLKIQKPLLQKEYNGQDVSDKVELVMYVIGDEAEDEQKVLGKINEKWKKRLMLL
ncbi:MAG: hypothetical protein ACLTML_09080 [Blautia faecis]